MNYHFKLMRYQMFKYTRFNIMFEYTFTKDSKKYILGGIAD